MTLIRFRDQVLRPVFRAKDRQYPRSILLLTGGTTIGQLATLLASPILTRLYGPGEWGTYGVLLAAFGVAAVLACLRYEVAIPAAKDDREAASLVALSLGLGAVLSVMATLILAGSLRFVPFLLRDLRAREALLLLPLLLLHIPYVTLRYWSLRAGWFGLISRAWVTQTTGKAGLQTTFGFTAIGWSGLLLGDIGGRLAALLVYLRTAGTRIRKDLREIGRREVQEVARRHRHFALFGLPSSMVDILTANIPVPALAQLYGTEAAGAFALVQRVVAVPMNLVGANVADAFHSRLAALAPESPRRCRSLFWKTAGVLVTAGFVPALVLILFGEPLFRLVFGDRWGEAGRMAALVAPWAWAQLAVGPLSRLVFVLGGQALKLVYDIVALSAVAGSLALAAVKAWPLLVTVKVVALAATGSYLVYFLVLLLILRRWTSRQMTDHAGEAHP